MQYVIKNGEVLATHPDAQDVTGLYPGAEVVCSEARAEPGDLDPTTQADRDRTAQVALKRDLSDRRDADVAALFEAVAALAKREPLPKCYADAAAARETLTLSAE